MTNSRKDVITKNLIEYIEDIINTSLNLKETLKKEIGMTDEEIAYFEEI